MTDPPAVDCHDLRYRFGETVAVDGVDLAVHQGEIFGLLGPNGAGKTTTIRVITTLLPVPAGVITVFGRDVARQRMAVRRLIGYVPQQLSADAASPARRTWPCSPGCSTSPGGSGAARSRACWSRWASPTRPTGSPHVLRRHGPPARARPGAGQRARGC